MKYGFNLLNFLATILTLNSASGAWNEPSQNFSFQAELVNQKYHVYWAYDETNITFEVHAQTQGWVGFGLSTNGRMYKSDIVIAWIDSSGKGTIIDMHGDTRDKGNVIPLKDEQQDYELLSTSRTDTGSIFKFRRKLDTCDDFDLKIVMGSVRFIYAWGTQTVNTFQEVSRHEYRGAKTSNLLIHENTARGIVYTESELMKIDLMNNEFAIPAKDTFYLCRLMKLPEIGQKYHLIKWEPIIQRKNLGIVHHFVIYICSKDISADMHNTEHECSHPNMPADFKKCQGIMMAWGIGGGSFDLPNEAGISFGTESDPKFVMLETHYDNPSLKSGITDSSGVRLTLTWRLRKHDAGLLMIGRDVKKTLLVPPGQEEYISHGYCTNQCINAALTSTGVKEIKAFGYFLHSHLIGRGLRTRHIRNGIEIGNLGEDLTYDFNFQEMRLLNPPVTITGDDTLITECLYNSRERKNPTIGGQASTEEMCLNFVLYYPKIKLNNCISVKHVHELLYMQCVDYFENGTTKQAEYRDKKPQELWEHLIETKSNWADPTRVKLMRTNDKFGSFFQVCVDGSDYNHNLGEKSIQTGPQVTKYLTEQSMCPNLNKVPKKSNVLESDYNNEKEFTDARDKLCAEEESNNDSKKDDNEDGNGGAIFKSSKSVIHVLVVIVLLSKSYFNM